MFGRKYGLKGQYCNLELMPLCNFNCRMFTIVLIVHTLCNQLLLELSVYPCNTLQICYRHIVDVHEELIRRKIYF